MSNPSQPKGSILASNVIKVYAQEVIFYNENLNNEQKIAEYKKLLPLYPQCTGGLNLPFSPLFISTNLVNSILRD